MSRSGGRRRAVTATEAARNFSQLVDRVREGGEPYIVERQGRPIARIAPVGGSACSLADLARWFEARRPVPEGYRTAVTGHVRRANRPRVPPARWQP